MICKFLIVWFIYSRVLHKSPWYPSLQSAKHVPLVFKHWLTSRQFPHVSLHSRPYVPTAQAVEKCKYKPCTFPLIIKLNVVAQ